ncbi:phospholipase A2 inhibitor and Ly6/PLAUR domain-containing protein-like [Hyla sarda]|uniref:phospholipase A2 inhibitor and Ly6/PLAUR domain-containing protein-like n=1 Tax=Hyla sarda TaxID=327740 RepID=UPI0024C315F1|nr:phospholipase A2 inhibitor and Ly6/PLAUR domain-containing protein-like [Hyla sarda]
MNTLLSIYIFSITITTGIGLVCRSCKNYLGDSCTLATTETCAPSVTSCYTSLMVAKFGNPFYPVVVKSCATHGELCHFTYNMSAGVELYNEVKCCEGDMCNEETIKLPPKNSTENGVQCPVCYAGAKSCTPTGNIKCQGPQTKCFTFSGGIYDERRFEDGAFQGCATENLCLNRVPTYPETVFQEGYTLTCTDSKP